MTPPADRPAADSPPVPPAAREALGDLYAEAAAALAELGACAACGRCCHFEQMGHTLFATELELAYLRQGTAEAGREAPGAARPGRCPWQAGARCLAHAWRPLGCRVFLCEPVDAGALAAASEELHWRLRRLHERHGLAYRYGPFLQAPAREPS
jgi:Fe-S-cluster containining protein